MVSLLVAQGCGADGTTTTEGASTSTTGDDATTGSNPTTTPNPTTATEPTSGDPTTGGPPVTTTTTGDTTGTPDSTTTTDGSTTGQIGDTEHVDESGSSTEPAPTCDDGLLNQDESDIDCGGMICNPCADGAACAQNSDCDLNSCINNLCAAPSCSDSQKNGDETDVDCGGTCPACDDNLACLVAEDCGSLVCTEGVCSPANCGDTVLNGAESDVDCGGDMCDGCIGGGECELDDDCLSETCTDGVCDATECLVDADCDSFDGECTEGDCLMPGFICQAKPVNDGQACEDNNLCVMGTVCGAGTCGGGAPVDCSAMTDQCNIGSCDPDNGQCITNQVPANTACFQSTCSSNNVCEEGACGDPDTQPFEFYEDFSDNSAGWMLDPEWAIGVTTTSNCGGLTDPASDHTPTTDNKVAGVVLGGCYTATIHDYYCLTSPKIDTSGIAGTAYLSYWRWLNSDYANYAINKIDVFDGNTKQWVNLFLTGGFPGVEDTSWKFFSHDITAYKHADFQARWCFKIGSGVFLRSSWNVDDVVVGPNTCGP